MYRNTYVEVNLKNIEYNVKSFIQKYNDYKYYFGVVKADCYAHNGIETVKTIIDAGCNYLAVATLDEALEIRQDLKDVPILCLGIISLDFIDLCIKNNITITISNLEYVKELLKLSDSMDLSKLKVHLKVNSGMNRLGINDANEFKDIFDCLTRYKVDIEGIYTHIFDPLSKERTLKQYNKFEEVTKNINLSKIKIVHVAASDATMEFEKRQYANGCRLGIVMYGLGDSEKLNLKSTFSLYSEIIQINEIENETVGYSGKYKVNGKEKIAIVPIGYADGVIRKNTGRNVYINECKYPIVGNVCMDMLFVKVDDKVKVGDKVVVIKDIDHIKEIANYLDTITYEVICSIGKRVPRVYKK